MRLERERLYKIREEMNQQEVLRQLQIRQEEEESERAKQENERVKNREL